MAYKNTVAIIGASTKIGTTIAKSIASRCRLLLVEEDFTLAEALQSELGNSNFGAEVETVSCCTDACWEADIIVVAIDRERLDEAVVKMKVVTNCKIVIHFTSDNRDENLKQLLPHAKIITVQLDQAFTDTNLNAVEYGVDEKAMYLVRHIINAVQAGAEIS